VIVDVVVDVVMDQDVNATWTSTISVDAERDRTSLTLLLDSVATTIGSVTLRLAGSDRSTRLPRHPP
jgi:hypothetical protein